MASSVAAVAVVPPISDSTSEAERPSTFVPLILKKSSSATPVVNSATLPFPMPFVSAATSTHADPL